MLNKLRIQNFKCWKDTGSIRMAPITIFFGANSSGKSSIGQFLMMLKQTVESPDRKAVFFPGNLNSAVQLGSYREMVYQRNLENRVEFEYEWNLPSQLRFKDALKTKKNVYVTNQIKFSAKVGVEDTSYGKICMEEFEYTLSLKDRKPLSIGMGRHFSDNKYQYPVNVKNYPLKRNQGRPWDPDSTVRFYGFPDEVIAYYQNAEFVQTINLQHENLFKSLFYLGPLRTKTDRLYTWSGITPASVGYSGENTVAALLASRGRKLSFGCRKTTKPLEKIVAENLKRMGLIEEFKVNPISKQRQDYEVKLRTRGSKDFVDLPDVGFGISQVLPVLVQSFYAPPESIIIMEQPEIHLHPAAQSELADVLIDVINSKENGKARNIQLIIETHSEHFLRRLQRRIAENKLPQEKVSAYFANITKSPVKLTPLEIDSFGNILNWPGNFFGDEMNDIAAQAKAAMKKRMEQRAEKKEVSE
jgi:predicted ATPase